MNVLVIGAAGRTGLEVVKYALTAGHEVTAFVRAASDDLRSKPVRVVEGDALDKELIDAAVKGQDAVIDVIGRGHKAFLTTDLEQSVAKYVILAMERHAVSRLLVMSMLGEGDSKANASLFYEYLLLPTYLRGADKDKAAMEAEVRGSGLTWTIVRPAVLIDDAPTKQVSVVDPESGDTAHKISRSDVAIFMVQQLTSDAFSRQAVTIATS